MRPGWACAELTQTGAGAAGCRSRPLTQGAGERHPAPAAGRPYPRTATRGVDPVRAREDPARRQPVTVVAVPGSKSVTARALFLAAAAEGETDCAARCSRTTPTASPRAWPPGLRRRSAPPDAWTVTGRPQGPAAAEADVYCRDARHRRPLPARAGRGRPRRLPLRRLRADAPPPGRARSPTRCATLGVDLRARGGGGPPAAHRRADGIKGGEVDARRRPVLAVPDRAAAGRPAHRARACDHRHRHRLRAVRGDHPGDDAPLRRRRWHARATPSSCRRGGYRRHRLRRSSRTPPPRATSSPRPR